MSPVRIFLIGYMGAGKTTLGRPLAGRLDIPFVDLDQVIEEGEDKSITGLFEELGEETFREKERDYLQNGKFPPDFVMATGGGAPCFFDNMAWMNREGLTVYLRADPREIARRLEHEREKRPLLRAVKKEELPLVIAERVMKREEYYLQAHIVLETSREMKVESLLEALKDRIR
ncbi:MAG TPA: shikimate kinase [Anseongella sp.]|nr:shikimate kinase [Anseongella sp.]